MLRLAFVSRAIVNAIQTITGQIFINLTLQIKRSVIPVTSAQRIAFILAFSKLAVHTFFHLARVYAFSSFAYLPIIRALFIRYTPQRLTILPITNVIWFAYEWSIIARLIEVKCNIHLLAWRTNPRHDVYSLSWLSDAASIRRRTRRG